MAINQNHLFEDIDGVKCAVVEKNIKQERVDFIRPLLEYNGYKVIVGAAAPPKTAAVAAPAADATVEPAPVSDTPSAFTLGVTDVSFNAINAIFGRLLKTKEGNVVTLAYWQEKEKISNDLLPYFQKGNWR